MTTQTVTTKRIATAPAFIAQRAISADQGRLDWFGVLCSFGCAVHCAALPVLMATLPSLTSLRWLADPLLHQIVAVLCGVIVARAILPGYYKHRDSRVVTLAGVGLSLLFIAAFILPDKCCPDATRLNTGSEVAKRGPKIVLVSSISENGASATNLQPFDADTRLVNDPCQSESCPHSATLSRPLLTAYELEGQLGASGAQALIQAQPYLSPIGGVFLIVAHIMNIRLRCCRRSVCRVA